MKDQTKKLKPIFISGLYRSGTTLVTRMLNNHPSLSVTYDSVHFMRFSYDKYNPIALKENYSSLIKEIQERIHRRWEMSFDAQAVIDKLNLEPYLDYADVYDALMQEILLKPKKEALRWGEKTNVCWGQIPNFLKMFPEGKTIHVIRDPRGVLSSFKNMTEEPGLRYLDTAFAALNSFHSAQDYLKTIPENNFYCLKYETLISNPKKELKALCDFLEIEFDPIMTDHTKFTDRTGKFWSGESSFEPLICGISDKPVDRWKEKLTKVEVFFMEMILREQMVHFGYELCASALGKDEWDELYGILSDPFINQRYNYWLKTGKGTEAYPSDPILWAKRDSGASNPLKI